MYLFMLMTMAGEGERGAQYVLVGGSKLSGWLPLYIFLLVNVNGAIFQFGCCDMPQESAAAGCTTR